MSESSDEESADDYTNSICEGCGFDCCQCDNREVFGVTPPGNDTPPMRDWIRQTAHDAGWTDLEWVEATDNHGNPYISGSWGIGPRRAHDHAARSATEPPSTPRTCCTKPIEGEPMTKKNTQTEKTLATHADAVEQLRAGRKALTERGRTDTATAPDPHADTIDAVALAERARRPATCRSVLAIRMVDGFECPATVQRVLPDGTVNLCVMSDEDERAAPFNVPRVPHEDVALAEGSTHRGWMWKWPGR